MAQNRTSSPLPTPSAANLVSADVVASGPAIPAIERIRLFSDKQWEEFVLEWAASLDKEYIRVERCGGAGDMGRDVIAMCKQPNVGWDNYQCKHYPAPLQPIDIWVEFGKLVYYTRQGAYTYPRRYFFVAPQGAGTKLSNMLKNPARLRAEFLANWDKYCKGSITSKTDVVLDQALRTYIDSLDFSIFDYIPPLRLIEQHAVTRWHVARFGGGLPPRPPVAAPPVSPAAIEARYLRQLLDAYGEHLRQALASPADMPPGSLLREHLISSREEFYSAESLRSFSRDTLPPGEFEKLQDEVHAGIIDEVRSDHQDGYRRILAVVRTARALQITSHALVSRLAVRDRGGICHQLANNDRVRWKR